MDDTVILAVSAMLCLVVLIAAIVIHRPCVPICTSVVRPPWSEGFTEAPPRKEREGVVRPTQCYTDKYFPRAMIPVPGVQGYDKCRQVAVSRKYKYFALQNDGRECYVSNDSTAATGPGRYGLSDQCPPPAPAKGSGDLVSLGGKFANFVYAVNGAPVPPVPVRETPAKPKTQPPTAEAVASVRLPDAPS